MSLPGEAEITVQTVPSQQFKRRIGYFATVVAATDRAIALDRVGHGETVYVVSRRVFTRLQQLVERHGWEDPPVSSETLGQS